jgi:hypothetical protein
MRGRRPRRAPGREGGDWGWVVVCVAEQKRRVCWGGMTEGQAGRGVACVLEVGHRTRSGFSRPEVRPGSCVAVCMVCVPALNFCTHCGGAIARLAGPKQQGKRVEMHGAVVVRSYALGVASLWLCLPSRTRQADSQAGRQDDVVIISDHHTGCAPVARLKQKAWLRARLVWGAQGLMGCGFCQYQTSYAWVLFIWIFMTIGRCF